MKLIHFDGLFLWWNDILEPNCQKGGFNFFFVSAASRTRSKTNFQAVDPKEIRNEDPWRKKANKTNISIDHFLPVEVIMRTNGRQATHENHTQNKSFFSLSGPRESLEAEQTFCLFCAFFPKGQQKNQANWPKSKVSLIYGAWKTFVLVQLVQQIIYDENILARIFSTTTTASRQVKNIFNNTNIHPIWPDWSNSFAKLLLLYEPLGPTG